MSLLDEITSENTKPRHDCMVCFCIRDMSREDSTELVSCLSDATYTATSIARVLNARGYPIHVEGKQIRRHRKMCI
jgi:hypothetical protein